jgi:NTP pyrophosphatase (non-canonical NTP hydrolase)|tara:strand:+ start:22 stop:384 length:363 start_codon:yes stop_codon:yes gene_type:complete
MRTTRLEEVTRVENWGEERGLLMEEGTATANPDVHQQERYLYPDEKNAQTLKLMEEVGELAKAVAYRDEEALMDGIGDCAVVLIILAAQNGLTFEECLDHAWDEIKGRTGKLEDGLFKKD